jgi:hypothetical protein
LPPALDVGKGFGFRFGFGCHVVCMPHIIHTCQGKNIKLHETLRKIAGQPALMRGFEFRARN